MTNEKMEQRLAAALEKTAPDDVSGVLSRCEVRKGTVSSMKANHTIKKKWATLVAACLAVISAPDFSPASTTSVPSASPARMRLRAGNWLRRGGVPGGYSLTTTPASAMRACSGAWLGG